MTPRSTTSPTSTPTTPTTRSRTPGPPPTSRSRSAPATAACSTSARRSASAAWRRALEAARALGRPIDRPTARRLQLTWWALRGERSTYRALVATVAILREAGVLLGEPDAGLSYEMLNVLRDSQLTLRPSGLDLQIAFGEGYLQRPDQPPPAESGRVEQLLAAGRLRRAARRRQAGGCPAARTRGSGCSRPTRSRRRGRSAPPRGPAGSPTASTAIRSARSTSRASSSCPTTT